MKKNKIRQSAKGEVCALRIPGVCNGNTETTVLCHAPYSGRGGMRNHDWWAAYGCSECHALIDGHGYHAYWHNAIHETQMKLIAKGLM